MYSGVIINQITRRGVKMVREDSFLQEDMVHMIKLEELFYNRFLNIDLLNELVSLYVKAIDLCN